MSFPQEPSWKTGPKTKTLAKARVNSTGEALAEQQSFALDTDLEAVAPTPAAAAALPVQDSEHSAEPIVLSVEQLNREIRGTLEKRFDLVWVQGELSNFKAHSSGHFYFSLKDAKAQIKAVMFRGHNARLKFKPHDGLEVVVRGRVTVYEPRGDYQITVETMEPVGAGALQKAFEQLKVKLQAEGLFAATRKRALPPFPKGIALVTSPTGAAIRDMLNILARRNRGIPITVIPTIVQGEAAAPKIIEALRMAYRLPEIDVIIVGRGGGSMEDLWAFNSESLARVISESPVPVISAVGHEVDFTIADFVADLRAPTPSAAAELVVQNVGELNDRILKLDRLLGLAMRKSFHQIRNRAALLQRRLIDPRKTLQNLIQRNDELLERLALAMGHVISRKESQRKVLRSRLYSPEQILKSARQNIVQLQRRLESAAQKRWTLAESRLRNAMAVLDTLSPLRTLDRGYALVYQEDKQSLVQSIKQVEKKSQLQIRVADGWIRTAVTDVEASAKS